MYTGCSSSDRSGMGRWSGQCHHLGKRTCTAWGWIGLRRAGPGVVTLGIVVFGAACGVFSALVWSTPWLGLSVAFAVVAVLLSWSVRRGRSRSLSGTGRPDGALHGLPDDLPDSWDSPDSPDDPDLPPPPPSPRPPASRRLISQPRMPGRLPRSRYRRTQFRQLAPVSDVYDDWVRRTLGGPPGRLMFNPPDSMRLGQTERVEVRVTHTLGLDAAVLDRLRGRGEPRMEEIPAAPLMAVTLSLDPPRK